MRTDLLAPEYEEMVSVRDAYLAMEAFVAAYLARGDAAVSELLDFYISAKSGGLAARTNAPAEFLAALTKVKQSRE
jgi:hypothetical protein